MQKLPENWLTEGLIDFEYKKYMLLGYLKSVEQQFTSNKLYPNLSELIFHYTSLMKFRDNKKAAEEAFPKRLEQIDLENFVLSYRQIINDDALMGEIEKILDFSIPAIQRHLDEGKEIYEWIEGQLQLRPVGIQSLKTDEGYLFIRNGEERQTKVYRYSLTIFESASEKYRGIATHYISTYTTSISQTYEAIKLKILNNKKLLFLPSVYVVESDYRLPYGETLLPIAKRAFVRFLAQNK